MALSGTSLSSASTTGPGAAIMFDEPRLVVAQITYAGGPGNINVTLEGTLDGVTWTIFRQFSASAAGSVLLSNKADPPVIGARANLTLIGTGVSASVSAFLSATEF